jgi:2-oxoglutarate ferredoxin oxidoreductase subunit beta
MNRETGEKIAALQKPRLMTDAPNTYCSGCHYGMITRILCESMDELGIDGRAIGLAGVGCSFGSKPLHIGIDWASCPHGRAPAMATAIKRIHPEAIVFTVQGDGDLGAIGLGCFMNAVLRNEKLTTFFLNNAGYGQTGGQMAPTSLLGMKTSTTPEGRDPATTGFPLHGAELVAGMKGVSYVARVSVHTPANYNKAKKAVMTAFRKQMDGLGYSFVEFVSACPTIWRMTPVDSLAFIEENMLKEYPLGVLKDESEPAL